MAWRVYCRPAGAARGTLVIAAGINARSRILRDNAQKLCSSLFIVKRSLPLRGARARTSKATTKHAGGRGRSRGGGAASRDVD